MKSCFNFIKVSFDALIYCIIICLDFSVICVSVCPLIFCSVCIFILVCCYNTNRVILKIQSVPDTHTHTSHTHTHTHTHHTHTTHTRMHAHMHTHVHKYGPILSLLVMGSWWWWLKAVLSCIIFTDMLVWLTFFFTVNNQPTTCGQLEAAWTAAYQHYSNLGTHCQVGQLVGCCITICTNMKGKFHANQSTKQNKQQQNPQ